MIARGVHMQACCEAQPSGMVSFLGLSADELGPAVAAGGEGCGVANDNAPKQVVLSGPTAGLELAIAKAKELGVKRSIPLNVAGAYHSALMAPAGESLRGDLAAAAFSAPKLPVYANVNAQPHTGDADATRELLVAQVSGTVRFRESMDAMFAQGVETFFEFGPGGVLKGLVRQNDRKKQCTSVATVEEVKAAAELLAARA